MPLQNHKVPMLNFRNSDRVSSQLYVLYLQNLDSDFCVQLWHLFLLRLFGHKVKFIKSFTKHLSFSVMLFKKSLGNTDEVHLLFFQSATTKGWSWQDVLHCRWYQLMMEPTAVHMVCFIFTDCWGSRIPHCLRTLYLNHERFIMDHRNQSSKLHY